MLYLGFVAYFTHANCVMYNGSATVVSFTQAMCHLDVVLFPNRVWKYYFEAVSLTAELSFQQLKTSVLIRT